MYECKTCSKLPKLHDLQKFVVLFFKHGSGNSSERKYGKSSHNHHQTFTIQVALLCPIDIVDVSLVDNCILKCRFTVCSWVETALFNS